jgi:hypothetical protein
MGAVEHRPTDGEIKVALPTSTKPLTWLGFVRGRRSARVPLAEEGRGISTLFTALNFSMHAEDGEDDRSR